MRRGFTSLEVLLLVAVIGAVLGGATKWFHGDSKRAKDSQVATANVNAATDAVDSVAKKRSATAAASVAEIGKAAHDAPTSPQSEFIKREVEVALSNLEKPDFEAQLRSHQRYISFLEGRLDKADEQYAREFSRSVVLTQERDSALADLNQARIERDAVDNELVKVAAVRMAEQRQRMLLGAGLAVLVVLYLWVKFTHFSPHQMAESVSNIRKGDEPIVAIDSSANRLQQFLVRTINKLK